MCGRFAFKMTWREIHDLLAHGRFPPRLEAELQASYNVAPTHATPTIHRDGRDRVLELSRWGFVPSCWTRPELPSHTINARGETVATSNLFRGAFKSARCIVPASGYYEWMKTDAGKRPQYISRADRGPLLMAGIHACYQDVDTFAVITTSAPHGMESIHDRSPVILEPEQLDAWLDGSTPAANVQAMVRPAADGVLAWHEVHAAVGNVRNNGSELIEPLARP